MPSVYVFSRSTADFQSPSHRPVYIAGFIVAAVILLAVAAWVCLARYRKHAANKREENLGAAFLSVRGLVKDPDSAPWIEKDTVVGYVYSRCNNYTHFNALQSYRTKFNGFLWSQRQPSDNIFS